MPHASPYPPVTIPDEDIWTFLFERQTKPFPDSKVLFTDGATGRALTFADVRLDAAEFGQGLKALWAWKPGDVLAFYSTNSIDTPALTLGALWAGAVVTPANPLATPAELARQLADAGARVLVTQAPLLAAAREAAAHAGLPADRIIVLGEEPDPSGRARHVAAVRSTAYCGRYARARPGSGDTALLVYSSGTTGTPKGVRLTHRNVVANLLQMAAVEGKHLRPEGGPSGEGDKGLGFIPFFHIYGLSCCVLMSVYQGWQQVVMARFDLEKACRLIQDHGVTFAYVPPPVVLALVTHPAVGRYDLSSLRVLHAAAAPLPPGLARAVWERLGVPVKQGFGLSEASPATHIQAPDEWAEFAGSVGKLLPNQEAMIVDADGNEVAVGETGELWLRGPNAFAGYHNQPERTREAFSADGWLRTGDVFRVDRHGNYYPVDRLKELIKYKGYQVAPAELEALLLRHADVADACVVGIEDRANATEVPRAYVVLREGRPRDEGAARDIAEWLARQTAPHKKLRGGVRFVDEVPRSPAGKLLRRLLRDRAREEDRKDGARL